MAERTAILIDSDGEFLGTASNPLYVGGIVSVGSLVDLTDVAIASPASGDYIGYDAVTGKYVNKPVTGTGMGDVTGPSGATAGNFPVLDASGKILSDSGVSPTSFGDVDGPAASTARSLAGFSDTGGKTLISLSPTVSAGGVLDMKGQKIIGVAPPDDSGDVATKLYVDQFIQGVSWQPPVIAILSASPANPVDEDRYIIADAATGEWLAHQDSIATWWAAGLRWVYTAPGDGYAAYNEYTGTIWVYNESTQHWVNIGSSGVPEAPSTGTPYSRQDGAWISAQERLFEVNSDDQIYPVPSPQMASVVQLCTAESGNHPYSHTWDDVEVYVTDGAVVVLRGPTGVFTVDDSIDLVTPLGTFTYDINLIQTQPIDVTSRFNLGYNTCHIRTYSTQPTLYSTPELFLDISPPGTRDIVPRNASTGFVGTETDYWRGVCAYTIIALNGFKVGADVLSYLHVGAAPTSHVHALATQVASGFMPQLNGDVASYLRGDGTWGDPGTSVVQVNADWNAAVGVASILNKPDLGTAAYLDVGTDAGDVVQLTNDGKLPAVDGSELTGVIATTVAYVASEDSVLLPASPAVGYIVDFIGTGSPWSITANIGQYIRLLSDESVSGGVLSGSGYEDVLLVYVGNIGGHNTWKVRWYSGSLTAV